MGGWYEALKKYEDNRRGVRGVANHKGQNGILFGTKRTIVHFFRYSKCSRAKRNQNLQKSFWEVNMGGVV